MTGYWSPPQSNLLASNQASGLCFPLVWMLGLSRFLISLSVQVYCFEEQSPPEEIFWKPADIGFATSKRACCFAGEPGSAGPHSAQ